MYSTTKKFHNVSRTNVLNPAMTAIWDDMNIGVAVVNAQGICEYMNPIQRRIDGFSRIKVVGQHITSLYVPHELDRIPTIECLRKGEPILKKSYFYKTTKNYLASTVTDFFPLFDHGKKDGVITFIIWTGNTSLVERDHRRVKPVPSKNKAYDFYTFESIVGEGESLREVVKEARIAAQTDSPVMIWGESGTGKEIFAQAIHAESGRRGNSFVAVNCAAIPENLLEGLLFGTVKGAYTDAPDKPGLFEKADGGTLLLDELNSMPLGLQAKLLRALQEKRVRRLGSHKEVPVDVRVVSILNQPPLEAIGTGSLRNDLYYRLAVVGIKAPPLRDRKEDISLLAQTFIDRSPLRKNTDPISISEEVLRIFLTYDWPGNIRELLHVIEGSLALLPAHNRIERSGLPRHFRESCTDGNGVQSAVPPLQSPQVPETILATKAYYDYDGVTKSSVIPLKNSVREYETQCIRNVLRVTGGNVAKAARIFQITAAGLRYKMKQLDIRDED
ncbi:sigma-54 interaction domain-containing protein [Desulfoplanes sp.]